MLSSDFRLTQSPGPDQAQSVYRKEISSNDEARDNIISCYLYVDSVGKLVRDEAVAKLVSVRAEARFTDFSLPILTNEQRARACTKIPCTSRDCDF